MRSATVTASSHVDAPPDRVWASARTMRGVNAELRPLVRMTVPRRARGMTLDEAPVGERAITSVLLAFGVVPFDVHFLTIAEKRERGFLERSSSLLQRLWEHERSVEPDGTGSRVTDRVTFEPRVPGAARLARPVVAAIFRHRHRRLAKLR